MNQMRMHPLKIAQSFFSLIKNSAIIILYLFVFRLNDTSFIPKYGRILFLLFLTYQVIAIVIEWLQTTYEIKDNYIHIYQGLFKKRHNRVALATIQHVQRNTPFYFKPFGITALNLETSATDKRASVAFEAITVEEAKRIEEVLEQVKYNQLPIEEKGQSETETETDRELSTFQEVQSDVEKVRSENTSTKEIDFQPSRQELIRASFLSLSFLVVIPILITMYENVEGFIPIEDHALRIFNTIRQSWLLISMTIGLLAVILVGIGVLRTFLKYGKYEISSDHDYIYIRMGTLNEQYFSIRKGNVQAIHIIQTPIKKWLGLCEIKLVIAESVEEESFNISTLYPYMDKDRAHQIIRKLLPEFPVLNKVDCLPKESLTMKMIRIPWFLIFAAFVILLFQKSWWFVLPILGVVTYLMRYFEYRNTRYAIEDGNIQFIKGGLWSSWFLTNRKKVIEIEVTRSFWQQKLGLATISTINQTKPIYQMDLEDIPVKVSKEFIDWYGSRTKEYM